MISAHVRYTVKAEYAAQNKENIGRVIQELQALNRPDIQYSVFIEEDGKTFNHWPMYATEKARNDFHSLESVKAFQAALQASNTEVPPAVTRLNVVGTTAKLV